MSAITSGRQFYLMRQNLYCEFLENYKSLESYSYIFEDSSPKVFFRQSVRTFDFEGFRGFLRLSSNPRYSRSGLLRVKILQAYGGFPEVFPIERAVENRSWKV